MAESTNFLRYKQIKLKDREDLGKYYVKTQHGAYVKVDHIRIFEGSRALDSIPKLRHIKKPNQKFVIYAEPGNEREYNQITAREGSSTFLLADDCLYEPYNSSVFVVESFSKASTSHKDPAMVEYSAYEVAKNPVNSADLFVKIRFENDSSDTIVPLNKLRTLDRKPVDVNSLKDLIGQPFFVDGDYRKAEPLTEEQAKLLERKQFEYESYSDADILKNDRETHTYSRLRIKSGKYAGQYVNEIDVVQPKCYNYTRNDTDKFDAYLVTDRDGRSYVVDKTYVPARNPSTVLFGKQQIEFRTGEDGNVQKLVRSTGGIVNSDVVQTQSYSARNSNTAYQCEVLDVNKQKINLLNQTDNDGNKEQLLNRIKEIYAKFLEDYKAKRYDIGSEILLLSPNPNNPDQLKGEFVEYVLNHRYMISDLMPYKDFGASEIKEILNMPKNGFKFDGKKLNGGAKYDFIKGMSDSYSKLGEFFAYSLVTTIGPLGALASLVSPFVIVGLAAVLVAAGVSIPIYHAIKKRTVEALRPKKNIYPSKIKKQNEKIKKDIFGELEHILQQVKRDEETFAKLPAEKRRAAMQERKQSILAELALTEHKLDLLSASKRGGEFSAADGIVNQSNTDEFNVYLKAVKDCSKEIKTVNKEIRAYQKRLNKGDKNLQEEYQHKLDRLEELNAQMESLKTKYHTTGTETELDPEQKELQEKINKAKGFIMVKYYGQPLTAASDLTKAKMEEYKEFARTTEISVDKKHKDFVYSHELKKGEHGPAKSALWNKRNKNRKDFLRAMENIGKSADLESRSPTVVSNYANIMEQRYNPIGAEDTNEFAPDVLTHPEVLEEMATEKKAAAKTRVVKQAPQPAPTPAKVAPKSPESPADSKGKGKRKTNGPEVKGDAPAAKVVAPDPKLDNFVNYYSKNDPNDFLRVAIVDGEERTQLDRSRIRAIKNAIHKYRKIKPGLDKEIKRLKTSSERKDVRRLQKLTKLRDRFDIFEDACKTSIGWYMDKPLSL